MEPDDKRILVVDGGNISTHLLHLISQQAMREGREILVVSPELTERHIEPRMLGLLSEPTPGGIERGLLPLHALVIPKDITDLPPMPPTPDLLKFKPADLLVKSMAAPFFDAFERDLERQNRPSRLPHIDSKLPKREKRNDKPWKKGKRSKA